MSNEHNFNREKSFNTLNKILDYAIEKKVRPSRACLELGFSDSTFRKTLLSIQRTQNLKLKPQLDIIESKIKTLNKLTEVIRVIKTIDSNIEVKKETVSLESILKERNLNKVKEENKTLKSKVEILLKRQEDLETSLENYKIINESEDKSFKIDLDEDKSKHTGIAVALYSDWHIEEKVDRKSLSVKNEFRNEYNPEIAEDRAKRCFKNTLKLVNKERKNIEIKQLIVWLGGDFISGGIHEELRQTNYLSPIEAIMFVKDILISGLDFLKDKGEFEKITVVCNYGNHGRITEKMQVSNGSETNYETILYQMIAQKFANNKIFSFVYDKSNLTYIDIENINFTNENKLTLRFFHGYEIKYQGGIGGLTIPLIKAISRFDKQLPAHYNFLGHFHQFIHPTKDCTVNGSLIGFNAYAQKIGAAPEKPVQGFRIIDSKYGFTISEPIICWDENQFK